MVGQTYEQQQIATSINPSDISAMQTPAEGEFQPIPTRIQNVPELIVDKADPQVTVEISETLGQLGQRLGTIHQTAAEAYMSQGQYAEAVPHVEAATGMAPTLENYNQLGYVRYLSGDDEGALQALSTVVASEPTNADAQFNIGMIQFGLEKLAEAEDAFRACSQVDANNPEVWNNLGVVLFKRGKAPEARTCFQRTLAMDPQNEDARFNLQNI